MVTLTGGQPDFVEHLLGHLRSAETNTRPQRVKEAANMLLRQGCYAANKALGDLAETLETHPGTRDLLEECVRGSQGMISLRSTQAMLPLVASGWIHLHRGQNGGWYEIRSWLHQGWARQLLITSTANRRPGGSSLRKG